MITETAGPHTHTRDRQRQWARVAGVLAVLGVLAILGLILATAALPRLSGYQTYVIYGSSMQPTIKLGSLILARPVPSDDLQVGDIIVFRSPGNGVTLTHRIVSIREEDGQRYFRTKGDASTGTDPMEVQLEGGVHKFAYELPYLGYFVDFARGPLGILLFVVLPAAGLVALQLTQGRKDRDNPDLAREDENLGEV